VFLRGTKLTPLYLTNFKAVITIQWYNPKIRSKVMIYVHFEIVTSHYHRITNQGFWGVTKLTPLYLTNFKTVITIQWYNPKIRSKVMIYVHFEIRTSHDHRIMNQGFWGVTKLTFPYLMNFKPVITIQVYNPNIQSSVIYDVHFEIRTFHYHRIMNHVKWTRF
jgi:hypothetical protein